MSSDTALQRRVTTQIVRESTIAYRDFPNVFGAAEAGSERRPLRHPVDALRDSIFYEAGGRPWKLHGVREGVCYVGMVFKRDDRNGGRTVLLLRRADIRRLR